MNDDRTGHTLYLIRHGETVDNVAGNYAGILDSALTAHGVLQINRLGEYLAKQNVKFSHAFSSDISRAFKTAAAIAQSQPEGLEVIQCKELREQDFGSLEGKPVSSRSDSTRKSSVANVSRPTDYREIETKESLGRRADKFLEDHLGPVLTSLPSESKVIAIVSHGMLLSALWKRLIARQRQGSICFNRDISAEQRPASLEHLGGWSNTGYLKLSLLRSSPTEEEDVSAIEPLVSSSDAKTARGTSASKTWPSFLMRIENINCLEHLKGLKRTRGGVGSSKYDENQRSINSFFKKQKRT